ERFRQKRKDRRCFVFYLLSTQFTVEVRARVARPSAGEGTADPARLCSNDAGPVVFRYAIRRALTRCGRVIACRRESPRMVTVGGWCGVWGPWDVKRRATTRLSAVTFGSVGTCARPVRKLAGQGCIGREIRCLRRGSGSMQFHGSVESDYPRSTRIPRSTNIT